MPEVLQSNAINVTDVNKIINDEGWQSGFRTDAMIKSFWGALTGAPGSDMAIIKMSVPGGVAGAAITVPLLRDLEGDGVQGDDVLQGKEEKISSSSQTVTPTLYRHGVANTGLARWASVASLVSFAANGLSGWWGRKRDGSIFGKMLATASRLFSGDATQRSELDKDCTFGTADLTRIKLRLQRMGARPLRVEIDDNGREVAYYGVVVSAIDVANLQQDDAWIKAHIHVGELAAKNPIFSGALGVWNGMIVYPYNEIAGSGSALRPETVVSEALEDDAVTIVVGGGKDNVDYTKYFPTAGTLLIEGESIAYTGKTATSFTGCTRGGDKAAHGVGALITLSNVTFQIGFGAEALVEGEGKAPTPVANSQDYGNVTGIGIETIDGFEVAVNTKGQPTSVIVMESYGAVA